MNQPSVLFELRDGVALVTLNEGHRMSPLGEGVLAGLQEAIDRVRSDTSVRAMILGGSGRGFCVGADLTHYQERLAQPAQAQTLGQYVGRLMEDKANPVVLGLRELPVPVVCAINGVAAGGGVGIALAGDLVVAARSAYFYLPFFPALGAVPDMGASWVMTRTIGRARTLGLALTGHKLSAQQAAEWGLIWACVEDDRLQDEAWRLAVQLAALPAHAIVEARELVASAERNSLAQQLDYERERQQVLVDGDSFTEGVRAFVGRRAPRFGGR